MIPATFWLGRISGALIALTLVMLGMLLFGDETSAGRHLAGNYTHSLDKQLRFLRSPMRAAFILIAQLALGLGCIGFALWSSEWLSLLLLPFFVFTPKLLIAKAAAQRIAKIEEQVEPWVNAVANALKASPSLGEAICSTTSLVASPMSQELDVLVQEYEFGTPLDQALENLGQRIQSKTLAGMVMALQIARRSGGNLTEMLETSAASLREFARLEGVVRTKTAEGKAQAFVIGMIPAPMVLAIRHIDPHFFDPLYHTFMGQLIIAGALVLWAAAIAAARKILDVDI